MFAVKKRDFLPVKYNSLNSYQQHQTLKIAICISAYSHKVTVHICVKKGVSVHFGHHDTSATGHFGPARDTSAPDRGKVGTLLHQDNSEF